MSAEKLVLGLRTIQQCGLQELTSVDFLVDVISSIGLFYDPRNIYGTPGNEFMNDEDGLWQIPRQLAEFLVAVHEFPITSYLEVGVFKGYTIHFINAYLRRFNPTLQSLGIDPNSFCTIGRNWEYRLSTSDDLAGQYFDLVFIDGDHSYDWVKRDWENVGRWARLCAFHDVNDHYVEEELGGGVVKFWKELQAGPGNFRSFLYHPQNERIMGIGLVQS